MFGNLGADVTEGKDSVMHAQRSNGLETSGQLDFRASSVPMCRVAQLEMGMGRRSVGEARGGTLNPKP